jgi:hypothetical protein
MLIAPMLAQFDAAQDQKLVFETSENVEVVRALPGCRIVIAASDRLSC